MNWFEKIYQYYKNGYWTAEMVHNAVAKGKITEEQYTDIVGEAYQA